MDGAGQIAPRLGFLGTQAARPTVVVLEMFTKPFHQTYYDGHASVETQLLKWNHARE
ncbi:MAG: hypothetical protein ABIT36_07900 [Steroidobacteraceae bacterium]